LRIVLLTLKFPPLLGGDVTHTLYLARFLSSQGIDTHVVTIKTKTASCFELDERLEVHRLGLPSTTTELERFGFKRLLYMILSSLWLLKLHFRERIDLVHAHGWDPAIVGGVFSRLFGVPLVLTVHGIPRPKEPLAGLMFPLLESLIVRLCSSRRSRLIALTQSDRSSLLEMGVDEEAIDIIPNGIDVEEFERIDSAGFRESHGISSEAFLVLFVGRLHGQKGVETLLRAANRLKEGDIHFLIVGSGHKEKEYKDLASALEVENTFFLGEIERDELLKAFASSDTFVLPSLFEGLPYVVLEAMAAGKPVVATRLPGLAEVIDEGVNGLLFDEGDDEELAEAILRLRGDRVAAEKMGEGGRELVEKRFDWRSVFKEVLEVYMRILERE